MLQDTLQVFGIAGAVAAFLLAAFGVYLAQAEPDQRRRTLTLLAAWAVNVLLLAWVLASWRRVTRNLELAKRDKLRTVTHRKWENGKSVEREKPKIAYPWLLVRPDAFGVVLTVWTRVGVGRAEFEKVADHLANTWRCRRVSVSQRKPGRITVRALRRDPLDARLSLVAPAMSVREREPNVEHIRSVQAS